jgi:hypothetical protein
MELAFPFLEAVPERMSWRKSAGSIREIRQPGLVVHSGLSEVVSLITVVSYS